ncbi:MAG: response regulator [Brevundimonas sp.]|uniref:hybrid sensor histidine kinase/response regulator n=1 Tax=Brevundimonas sp. TaxID=1871086 RepID=UPI00121E1961|nr:ATP-binding protein [Brevundimonas sp.]RZJ18311.1 MAG: response regulator [Brevundimonas sp.]
MQDAYAEDSTGWAYAARQRRRALLQRLGLGSACALVFGPILGWTFSTVWVALYFVIQAAELWAFAPINGNRAERLPTWRTLVGGAILCLNGAFFGSLSVPLWLTGGAMGGICAAIMLASGAIYSTVNAPRSTAAMLLTVAPQFAYLAATPFFMHALGAPSHFVTPVAIAMCAFMTYCVSTWQRMSQSRVAEDQARRDAERGRRAAEQAMAGRSAFLAAVGHDLRTPISAILTGAAELERTAGDSTSRSHAALISDAGLMMKALLDDLLDHARLDAGRMTVEASDFNLRVLLAQTLRMWQGPARAKGLKLRIEGAREAPSLVRGDPMRLRQVLNNLLSNAVKFTESGQVTLSIRAWDEDPAGHAVLIEIADTGPGMTAAQRARLFTPFDQTAEGVGSRFGGSGLGLAISRQLIELMGGRITVRSEVGQGARFILSLSLPAAEAAALEPGLESPGHRSRAAVARALTSASIPVPAPSTTPVVAASTPSAADILAGLTGGAPVAAPDPVRPPAPSPVTGAATPPVHAEPTSIAALAEASAEEDERPMRVLVVDDHDINRRAVQLILLPLGCDVSMAADGMAALRACETTAFDLIFMDVRMPELDGRETTRRLRAGGGPNANAPVIAVTADTAPEDIAACMAAGMTYFVSKPLTPPSLLGAVSHVMAGASAPGASAGGASAGGAATAAA